LTDKNLKPTNFTQGEQILNTGSTIDQLINGCFTAISTKMLNIILPIDFEYPLYDNFIHRIANLLDGRQFVNLPLQYYRRHDSNTSTNFASSLSKVSKWKSKLLFLKEDTFDYLNKELIVLDRIKVRLLNLRNEDVDIVFKNKIELALVRIDLEYLLIKNRLLIVSNKSLFKRFILAFSFYYKGGYRIFSGTSSLFKDIFKK
jgi:hypothetical protein